MKTALLALVMILGLASTALGDTIPNAAGSVRDGGFTRYSGSVVDEFGFPLEGVCVYAGPANGCPEPSIRSDNTGYWAVDLPSGFGWTFNFEKQGFRSGTAAAPAMIPPSGAFAILVVGTRTTLTR